MTLSRGNSKAKKYVCCDCVGDAILTREIAILPERICNYCENQRPAVALESLADRVDEVYRELVRTRDDYPTADPESDNPVYRPGGSSPQEIIQEMIECDTLDIAEDITSELSNREYYGVVKDGDFAFYDSSSESYAIDLPNDPTTRQTWSAFQQSIKHNGRFFNSNATKLLEEIITPILTEQWAHDISTVKIIKPTNEDRFVYRGRIAHDKQSQLKIHASPIRQLSAPPPNLNKAGRMNAAGIGAFYASFDRKTCIAELRCPVGGEVISGKFEIIRELRVLDLTALEKTSAYLSYFAPGFIERHSYTKFIRRFHDEIRKPVIPDHEQLDYLPTQFVCEYLWSQISPRFDGLVYGSAQLSEGANNIVLFPHALEVEGYREEIEDKTLQMHSFRAFEDEGEFDDPSMLEELLISESERDDIKPSASSSQATLRLLVNEIEISHVDAIKYEVTDRRIRRLNKSDRIDPF